MENQQKQATTVTTLNTNDKIVCLIKKIENDINACDFKWTLFVASANSYKYDSLLKPFPNAYVANKILNINRLREVIASVPCFSRLLAELRMAVDEESKTTGETNDITEECIDLLYWCLIRAKEPTLKSVHPTNVSSIWY